MAEVVYARSKMLLDEMESGMMIDQDIYKRRSECDAAYAKVTDLDDATYVHTHNVYLNREELASAHKHGHYSYDAVKDFHFRIPATDVYTWSGRVFVCRSSLGRAAAGYSGSK